MLSKASNRITDEFTSEVEEDFSKLVDEPGDKKICEDDIPDELLRQKPTEPSPFDCCGSGCNPCVYDIYEQELKIWQKECQIFLKKASGLDLETEEQFVITPDEYKKFLLINITSEASDCNIYRFLIPGNRGLGLEVGQHLILRGWVDDEPVTRQYTPFSPLDATGYFDILIKLYDEGKMSKYIASWKSGQEIEWRGPFGKFNYKRNMYPKILFVASGTGITPIIQVLHHILRDESDETFLRLLFACRFYCHIYLKNIIDRFKSYWNFTVQYCLSQETDKTIGKYGDSIHYGHIDQELITEELQQSAETFVVICGSKSFNSDIMKYCENIGISNEQCFAF